MTLNDIINLTPDKLNKLTAAELRPLIQQMNSAVNKQVKRLEYKKLSTSSKAVQELNRSGKGGKNKTALYTKGKTLNQLRSEFTRGVNFLNAPTSKVRGVEKYREHVAEAIKENTSVDIEDLSAKRVGIVFTALHKFQERYPAFYTPAILSHIVQATQQFPDKRRITADRLLAIIEEEYHLEYEENEAEYNDAFEENDDFMDGDF